MLAFLQSDDLVFGSLHKLTMDYQGGGGDMGTFYPLHFGAGAPQWGLFFYEKLAPVLMATMGNILHKLDMALHPWCALVRDTRDAIFLNRS